MPAILEDVEEAINEGVKAMPSWGPNRILKEHGRISGMELVQCTSVFNERGEFRPTFATDVKKIVEADQIILAIGQTADLSYVHQSLTTERGLIAVNKDSQATSMPGVFAGGDAATGTTSVIEAIAAGRKAASSIDSYLTGGRGLVEGPSSLGVRHLLKVDAVSLEKTPRVKMPKPPPSGRSVDIEDTRGLDLSAMETEAKRCFDCGCVAVNASDLAPALVALGARIETTKRTIDAEDFFDAGPMKLTVIDAGELVTRIEIPNSRAWNRQSYIKFRTRNSIDFPIASVASVFRINGNRIDDARIVLGATAPVPYRIREVEAFLKGKTVSDEVAERAGIVAVQESNPLSKNTYKVQIVKALVRRSILAARDTRTVG
jgi:CO/xanthine dehydrogenase FAD-binding subunit